MTGAPRFSSRLAALALRRALAPGILLWTAGLAAILSANDWGAGAAALGAELDAELADSVRAGLVRQGYWTAFALAIAPICVVRAAAVVAHWRATGEVDWLGSRAAGRLAIATSTACGAVLGAWTLVVAWSVLVAAKTPRADASYQLAGEVASPGGVWVDGAHARAWTADLPLGVRAAGTRVRVELGLGAGSGASTEVVLRARVDGREASARRRIGSRGTIEVELPAAAPAVALDLSVADRDARVLVLSDAAELWTPVADARAADRAIALRLCAAACAWIALAMGFGAWISAPSASAAVLALWLAAWLADGPCAWIPGADLPEALAIAAQGRVPRAVDPRAYAGALGALAVGLSLAASGLVRWRRET